MAESREVRRLKQKWDSGNSWPQFLEWIEIHRIRGWSGQRINFRFPVCSIVGENGSGKSTILQSAACAYQTGDPQSYQSFFPTEFFPDTAWESLTDSRIAFGYRCGENNSQLGSIRRPTTRWLGQPDRPRRNVIYIDLSRLQPVATRVGYARIAKNSHSEGSSVPFTEDQVGRLSRIMGREYDEAKIAKADIDTRREIPVLSKSQKAYSGFHQGSGETTIAELLKQQIPKYSLVLIDEVESSLHPRSQRRLVSDLARVARLQECQIILTTHSPAVLEELPLEARLYILESGTSKQIVYGVSPQFAMTKMDDHLHPDCELYVEDERAQVWLQEILSRHFPELATRCTITPYGAANVGISLGQMAQDKRFRIPTCVFLDGDQDDSHEGCSVLPGEDAPERVIFRDLRKTAWSNLWTRIGRDTSQVDDALSQAMTLSSHKDWLRAGANSLMCGSDVLWQLMCSEWAASTDKETLRYIEDTIIDALD